MFIFCQGCAVIPLIIAAIYSDSDDHYIPNVEILFVCLASVGFCVGLYMNFYDVHHDSILNRGAPATDPSSRKNRWNRSSIRAASSFVVYVMILFP